MAVLAASDNGGKESRHSEHNFLATLVRIEQAGGINENYDQLDKEALAVVGGMLKFHHSKRGKVTPSVSASSMAIAFRFGVHLRSNNGRRG